MMGPTDRVILLIDMDCFYCQVEEKLNPFLKDKPIAVVQYNAWRGGGIIAVNYPARAEGVTRHMRGDEAKKKCPSVNLVQVPEVRGKADLTKYRDAGKEVADVLATFTPLVQRASVDEAYLDITELVDNRIKADLRDLVAENLRNTFIVGADLEEFLNEVNSSKEFHVDNFKLVVGALITEEIRLAVYEKTGYKCSAGIAHNKILAKLVCSLHKPNKQTAIPQNAVESFFKEMPITKVGGFGGKFGESLCANFKIKYMGELAEVSIRDLMERYDEKSAKWLFNIAKGVDLEPVTSKLVSKSLASCKNFPGKSALKTPEDVQHWLKQLSEEIGSRLDKELKENNRKAKQLVVSFSQEMNWKEVSSSRTIPLQSYIPQKIAQTALDVLKKYCLKSDGTFHIKFLGLSAGHFEDVKGVRQITSYFQVGQIIKKSADVSANDTNSEIDENVYDQPTQEIEEETGLIFLDDAYRIKNSVEECSSDDHCQEFEEEPSLLNQSGSSFFKQFLEASSSKQEVQPLNETPELQNNNFDDSTEESQTQLCNSCNLNILNEEWVCHQDYHFALELSKSETPSRISPVKTVKQSTTKGSKGKKRKIENNTSLMSFLKPQNEEDLNIVKETCSECQKKIKPEEMITHMDYHMAKKIHLEMNKNASTSKPKPEKHKKKGSVQHGSITSFLGVK